MSDSDTASALGSGDVAVFGTPALVALCEQAAVRALDGALEPGQTTVGTRIELDHTAPTRPGVVVTATAVVTAVDGRSLTFGIEATDPAGPVGRGVHTRVVVDRERFEQGADERTA